MLGGAGGANDRAGTFIRGRDDIDLQAVVRGVWTTDGGLDCGLHQVPPGSGFR